MQNDGPQANVTDGSSDSDIEDEADWHDEVDVEELAPRQRSKFSEAMVVEVRSLRLTFSLILFQLKVGFVDANMGGFGHITWTFHLRRHTSSQPDWGRYITTGWWKCHIVGQQEHHTIAAGQWEWRLVAASWWG